MNSQRRKRRRELLLRPCNDLHSKCFGAGEVTSLFILSPSTEEFTSCFNLLDNFVGGFYFAFYFLCYPLFTRERGKRIAKLLELGWCNELFPVDPLSGSGTDPIEG